MGTTGTVDQPYQFSTKPYYPALGLSYFGYRFYNAPLGRWVNRDPLGESGGMNLYGFAGNNPVNGIDPYGLCTDTYYTYPEGLYLQLSSGSYTVGYGSDWGMSSGGIDFSWGMSSGGWSVSGGSGRSGGSNVISQSLPPNMQGYSQPGQKLADYVGVVGTGIAASTFVHDVTTKIKSPGAAAMAGGNLIANEFGALSPFMGKYGNRIGAAAGAVDLAYSFATAETTAALAAVQGAPIVTGIGLFGSFAGGYAIGTWAYGEFDFLKFGPQLYDILHPSY